MDTTAANPNTNETDDDMSVGRIKRLSKSYRSIIRVLAPLLPAASAIVSWIAHANMYTVVILFVITVAVWTLVRFPTAARQLRILIFGPVIPPRGSTHCFRW